LFRPAESTLEKLKPRPASEWLNDAQRARDLTMLHRWVLRPKSRRDLIDLFNKELLKARHLPRHQVLQISR